MAYLRLFSLRRQLQHFAKVDRHRCVMALIPFSGPQASKQEDRDFVASLLAGYYY